MIIDAIMGTEPLQYLIGLMRSESKKSNRLTNLGGQENVNVSAGKKVQRPDYSDGTAGIGPWTPSQQAIIDASNAEQARRREEVEAIGKAENRRIHGPDENRDSDPVGRPGPAQLADEISRYCEFQNRMLGPNDEPLDYEQARSHVLEAYKPGGKTRPGHVKQNPKLYRLEKEVEILQTAQYAHANSPDVVSRKKQAAERARDEVLGLMATGAIDAGNDMARDSAYRAALKKYGG
jgi:hypothetical protein